MLGAKELKYVFRITFQLRRRALHNLPMQCFVSERETIIIIFKQT